MIENIQFIIEHISGLWTLPWILVGFILTIILSKLIGQEQINKIMKKLGLVLLYFFVPFLLFRIFLSVNIGLEQIEFIIVTTLVLIFMYVLAFAFAKIKAEQLKLKGKDKHKFIKTVFTNQGRSSAFIGGALLTSPWKVEAAIFIALVGIALFAVVPAILSYWYKKESKKSDEKIQTLPWFLKIYPWYLLCFVIAAIVLHGPMQITVKWDESIGGILFKLFTAITIPAALYYVGSGIHPNDLKKNEMKKLFSLKKNKNTKDHWPWVRNIFLLTVIITPLILTAFFGLIYALGYITSAWFAVIAINSFLPITSTNMFLVPYDIDKKSTALSVTWSTIVCVPIIVFLIYIFTIFL